MSQTRFQLRPDGLIMVPATIHAVDYSKHVTIDLILDTGASITTINPDILLSKAEIIAVSRLMDLSVKIARQKRRRS